MPVVSTDALGEAARAVTTRVSHPDLHLGHRVDHRTYYTSNVPERLLADALRAHHALLPHLVRTIASPHLRAVWIEAPQTTIRSRLEADSHFVRGAADPALLIERFVRRSARMSDWLGEQAAACGLPYVMLSGSESPPEVAARCLEAMGVTPAQ